MGSEPDGTSTSSPINDVSPQLDTRHKAVLQAASLGGGGGMHTPLSMRKAATFGGARTPHAAAATGGSRCRIGGRCTCGAMQRNISMQQQRQVGTNAARHACMAVAG